MKLILGYGRSGQAVANVLSQRNEACYVSDIAEKNDQILYPNINYIWGEHPLWLLDKVGEIIVSPAIPMDSEIILKAKEKNIKIKSELEWAMEQISGLKFGITGTNGKSTTTALISHIFNFNNIKTTSAGNIGEPLSSFILKERFQAYSIEISSFQLETMKKKLLDGAILLNISQDHLDRHKNFESYKNIKKKIFQLLKDQDKAFASESIFLDLKLSRYGYSKECDLLITKDSLIYENEVVLRRDEFPLLGEHNWENAAGAILLSLKFGLDKNKIKSAIKTFKPLEHRMEIVEKINGITFINDSKGTNIDSVLKALTGMPKEKTILILGGKDKGSDFALLKEKIRNICKAVYCIGSAKEKIFNTIKDLNIQIFSVEGLDDVFSSLDFVLEEGCFVLLSPACASFDQYKNFEERGKHFKELVKKWKEKRSQIH